MRLGRKGDWIQLFLIAFFFLLLLISIILLLMQREVMVYERAEFYDDMAYEATHTALVNILRQPMDVDLNGDGTREQAMFADAIIREGVTQEELEAQLSRSIPDWLPYLFTLTKSDGTTIEVNHVKTSRTFLELFTKANLESFFRGRASTASISLHSGNGKVEAKLIFVDRAQLERLLLYKHSTAGKDAEVYRALQRDVDTVFYTQFEENTKEEQS